MKVIHAAGGIVWRDGPDGTEIVLVHRPAYDDWSFPKGKLERGEDERSAARREVVEETGLRPRLGDDLGTIAYQDAKRRRKVVRYFAMRADHDEPLRPTHEIDDARWFTLDRARAALSYDHDRLVLDRLSSSPG